GVDRGTRKDNGPVCRYRLWSRRWKSGCHAGDLSVIEPGACKTVSLFRRIVLTYREIPGVLIVAERLVADAEAPPNPSFLGQSVGYAKTRGEIAKGVHTPQIHGVAPDAGKHQGITCRIVVGKTAGVVRRRREVQLPAQPRINGQLGSHLPFVLSINEQLGLTPRSRDNRYVTTHLGGSVDEKRSEIICGSRARALNGSRSGAEPENATGPEGLRLYQVITQPSYIDARFKGMVAADFRPVADTVDIGLAAIP